MAEPLAARGPPSCIPNLVLFSELCSGDTETVGNYAPMPSPAGTIWQVFYVRDHIGKVISMLPGSDYKITGVLKDTPKYAHIRMISCR